MNVSRWMCSSALALVVGSGAVLAGCGGSEPPPQTPSTINHEEIADDLADHHRHHHHGGVTMFIALSLHALGDLTPEEKAQIEKIRADLFVKLEPARAKHEALVAAIADSLAAGSLDRAKIEPAVEEVKASAGAVHDASADALNALHKVLTPAQREALVHKVEAHWEVWQHANGAHPTQADAKARRLAHLAHLAKEIGLSDEQVVKVLATLQAEIAEKGHHFSPEKAEAHIKAFGAAFRSESFDAKTVNASEANAHLSAWGATRMVHFYAALDPVLTPEQRTKLVEFLRAHSKHQNAD